MQRENNVVLTGIFKTEQMSPTFTKQMIVFSSKDRDGNWRDGEFDIYIKPDIILAKDIQPGDVIKVKGFIVFNFFTKQDGTVMSFPKLLVSEVLDIEKIGSGSGNSSTSQAPNVNISQPSVMAPQVPPTPTQGDIAFPQPPQPPQPM